MTKKQISIVPVQTEVYHQGESLLAFLEKHLCAEDLEGKVLAITSKIISLAENQIVPATQISKADLVHQEADQYLCEGAYGTHLTIKHGLLIPSAGIDESNSEFSHYILFPKNPYASAEAIWKYLRTKFNLKNLGVVITDSHSMPLRKGVTGIGLSHWGFKAVRSLVGQEDLFGHPLKFTHVDILDSLAVMAVFIMGEANDSTPLALIEGADIEFTNSSSASEIAVALEDDIYYPLFK